MIAGLLKSSGELCDKQDVDTLETFFTLKLINR